MILVNPLRLLAPVLFTALLALPGFLGINSVCAQNIYVEGVSINVFYDLNDNMGFVEENITFNTASPSLTDVKIPLIPPPSSNSYYELINISYSGRNVYLTYSVDKKNNLLNILFNATKHIVIRYAIYNYIDEIGVGVYSMLLDFTSFSNMGSFNAKIRIIGGYNAQVYPPYGYSVKSSDEYVVVNIDQAEPYTIIITSEEFPSPTPITTTSGGAVVTTTPTTTYSKGIISVTGNLYLWIGIGVGAVVSVLAYLLYRRRSLGVEVETIAAGDLLSDETVREIIKAVGDAGVEGIKQSELVRITGRPKSTISRRVKRLADEGFVEIIRRGKYNIIRLTEKGLSIYKELKSGG